MAKTVAPKMGIKENSRAFFVNSDKEIMDAVNLPNLDVSIKLEDEFDYIQLFVKPNLNFWNSFQNIQKKKF